MEKSTSFLHRFLKRFHYIEDDSHWQIMSNIKESTPSHIKKRLLLQALEERQHATIFKRILIDSSLSPFLYESPTRSIYFNENNPERFTRLCEIGEADALKKFIHIHRHTKNAELKRGLHQIIKDEIQHAGSHKSADIKDKLFWFRYKYSNIGNQVAGQLISLLLVIIYLVILPYSLLVFLSKRVIR